MSDTWHIRIKKDYAKDVIEDLQKMEAVELVIDSDGNLFDIPEWQKELGREEVKNITENPTLLTDWEKVKLEFKL